MWDEGTNVPKQQMINSKTFKVKRGVRQRGNILPTIFNILIDAIFYDSN